VVRNQALSANRAAARRRRREQQASVPESWFDAEDTLHADDLARLLAALALELREVLVARIWGGLTFEEIADLIGSSLPTAHRRYQAALTELRERLTVDGHASPLLW
jgi:RNA polymerase sigma-70 factor (ECF subfamily)